MEPKKLTAGKVFGELGRAVCYLFLFLLCQGLVSTVYTLAAQLYAMLNPGQPVDLMELVLACTDQISLSSGLATLVILSAFFLLRRKNPLRESGFRHSPGRYVFLGCGIAPVFYTLVTLVLGLLPEAWLESYMEASSSLSQTGALMTIATVVVVPIVEEVVFRGLIQTRLNRVFPGWLAVLSSALLFGVCHGQIVWMAYAFVLGVVFGFLDLGARSIWPSLAAHVLFNGIGQLMVALENTQTDPWFVLLPLAAAGVAVCLIILIFCLVRPLKARAT